MKWDEQGAPLPRSAWRKCETVSDVLASATNQGIFYARLVRRDNGQISRDKNQKVEEKEKRMKKRVYIFGVVNVSRSTFVVKEHPDNQEARLLEAFEPIEEI